MKRHAAIFAALVALGLLAGCGSSSSSSSNDNAASTTPPAASTPDTTASDSGGEAETIKTTSGKLGTFLADGEGKTLYLFLKDKQGSGASTCSDACAAAWPPVTTEGAPSASAGADKGMLGTIKRADGTTQVTYNGWPLYYYAGDKNPGDTTGQGLDDDGGEWYVLSAKGDKIEGDES
jgi:predicted lipoprotein with Yx(FWY)xxD motif